MLLDKQQVTSFLPHRDPFLFIDSVELIEGRAEESLKDLEGKKVICHYYVDPEHVIFDGHFPNNPVLPGVIQVEMMGQASCFGVYYHIENKGLKVKLMGVNDAKFRKPVLPGTKLRVEAVCSKNRGTVLNYNCQVYEGDQIISEATILASVNV